MATFTKKQKKKIKKARAEGGKVAAQALKEKIRTRKGLTATKPGETPGSATTASQYAQDMARQEAMASNYMTAPIQTDEFGNQYRVTFDPQTGQPTIQRVFSDVNQQLFGGQQGYQQAMLGMGQGALSAAQGAMSQPYGYSGLQGVMGQDDLMGERRRVEDAYYQNQARMMEPQFQKERENFEQMAAERGWVPGSAVYQNEKNRMEQQQNTQRQQWAGTAAQAGLSEMQGQYGLSAEERQRQIKEYEAQRYGALGEAQGFYGAANPMMGQFQQSQFAGSAPVNYGNLALGYADIMQQPFMQQQKYQLEQQLLAQQMAGKGGGGAPEDPWTKYANLLKYEEAQRNMGLGAYYNPQQKTNWGDAAAGFATGIGSAIGSSF